MNFRKPSRSRRNSINLNVLVDSEKWRNCGKRLSRREAELLDEDSDDGEDEPKSTEMANWVEELFGRRSECSEAFDLQDIEVQLTRKQTLILSTLVPDEILLMETFDNIEPKRFVGVLLMADVSGYTALSERYNTSGKSGTYRLTVTLNTYLGSLIEIIYGHGGDVIKFAGDAFLALWKTDKRTFLYHTIHTVIACALLIQHSYGKYETDVKVNLKVKLAISAGNLMFTPIGSGIDMNYVIIGLPVIEAKLAESVCASGEVKLTPTAWAHCFSRNYDHLIHADGHVTIKSILYDPHEKDISKPFIGIGTLARQLRKTSAGIETLPDNLWDSPINLVPIDNHKKQEALSFRKAVFSAEARGIGSEIRKFMIRPVLTQIDAHQPLEYLTEMRQVSVLFITLKPRECPPAQLITIVNNSYQITCEIVYKSMGCVNKIILFDKDIMILVIFGLRGFKHESEAQAALKCSYSIKKSVSALDGVLEMSIGVTTGQVYCGVVGHPLRREFTVIGAIVNKAARLMCSFRNKITCDEATFVKSKMSTNGFTLQPKTELKGIGHPGKIFEYTEDIRTKELYDIPIIPPLLNRSDEMEYLQNWLDDSQKSYRDFDALLLVGESRIGKTRLLEWMSRYTKNKGYRVCYLTLTSIHSANPYLALTQIINQVLGLQEPVVGFKKEEKIFEIMNGYSEDMCYLNTIIKARFAYHEGVYSLNEDKRKEKTKCIFTKFVMAITETVVIFLDDLHNLDSSSWDFLSILLNTMKFFTVLTVSRVKFSDVHKWLYSVFSNNSIRKIVLGPLNSGWIPPLACQILDVDAVPNDLCNALRIKCNGMPGLVESFILHLFSTGALVLNKINENELEGWETEDFQFPESAQLRPQALDVKDQTILDQHMENELKREIAICVVTQKEELKTNFNVQNFDALMMIQIDSLTPYQQLLLKIASVIGSVLSRKLLENIMYENNSITTAKAIKRLFSMRVLSCANYKHRIRTNVAKASILSSTTHLVCECNFNYDPEMCENLPKYAFCKVMKFKNKNFRQTCYELLPVNQKKEFHSRIVNYLENNEQKCPNCGGEIMIVQSSMNLMTDEGVNLDCSYQSTDTNESNNSSQNIIQKLECVAHNSTASNNRESGNLNRTRSEIYSTSDQYPNLLIRSVSEKLEKKTSSISATSKKNTAQQPILKTFDPEYSEFKRRSTKRVTVSSLLYNKYINDNNHKSDDKVLDIIRPIVEAANISDWHNLGVIDSEENIDTWKSEKNEKCFSVKLEKNLSKINITKCTCAELKIVIYEQLINHASKAEMKFKVIEFLIQFSYLNLLANNIDIALENLLKVHELCSEKQVNEGMWTSFDTQRFLGRMYSLKAYAYLMSGKLLAAKTDLERAIRIYRLKMTKVSNFFRSGTLFAKLKRHKYKLNEITFKSESVFCLNVATLLYSTLGYVNLSRIAAFRAVEVIQMVACNEVDICDALSNAITLEVDRGNVVGSIELERVSCRVLNNLPKPIQADQLYALGKLFMAVFRARIARGELASAIRSGFRALTVSNFLQASNVVVDIIPDLFYILFSRRRIEEAIDIVQLALRLGQHQRSNVCEAWYYALCMDITLDAGFQLESPYEISRFSEFALNRLDREGAGRRRLVVNLWTFWLRIDSEKKAKRFESEALSWAEHDDGASSISGLLSALRLAEGMLESLARKVDDLRKVVDLMELRSIADKELARLEQDCRDMRAVFPRWTLLKASSLKLSGRQNAANSLYYQAMDEARKMRNHLEESLARAAMSHSKLWIQNARSDHFNNWHIGARQARNSWHQFLYKIATTRQ